MSMVVYAKVGTVPMLVKIDGRFKVKEGGKVRIRTPGGKWEMVTVDRVDGERLFLSR